MTKEQYAYKVFKRLAHGKLLGSAVITHGVLYTVYTPGQWSLAPCQGFFCFADQYYAREWMINDGHMLRVGELWLVQVRERILDARWVEPWFVESKQSMLSANMLLQLYGCDLADLYGLDGTVIYRRVLPIKRVDILIESGEVIDGHID